MNRQKQKPKKKFKEIVTDIRDELTIKVSEISRKNDINMEEAKLLKEMTLIIKELDKIIKDEQVIDSSYNTKEDFFEMIKKRTIIEQ